MPGAFAAERSFPVVLVGGDARRLVAALAADEVLCHRVDMILPFDQRVGTAAEVVAAARHGRRPVDEVEVVGGAPAAEVAGVARRPRP